MKKLIVSLIALMFALPASATTLCGVLTARKVMCIRAPCPALVSFSTGSGRPFSIDADETSQAMKFLDGLRDGKYKVCIKGQIERENLIKAEKITRARNR